MTGTRSFWRDPLFYLALAAAIMFWLALYLFTRPAVDLVWPLHEPLRFAIAALLYPVAEEVVFRGLVQDLAQLNLGRNLAVVGRLLDGPQQIRPVNNDHGNSRLCPSDLCSQRQDRARLIALDLGPDRRLEFPAGTIWIYQDLARGWQEPSQA